MGGLPIDHAIHNLNALKRDLEKMRSSGGAGIAYTGDTMITAFRRFKKFKRS